MINHLHAKVEESVEAPENSSSVLHILSSPVMMEMSGVRLTVVCFSLRLAANETPERRSMQVQPVAAGMVKAMRTQESPQLQPRPVEQRVGPRAAGCRCCHPPPHLQARRTRTLRRVTRTFTALSVDSISRQGCGSPGCCDRSAPLRDRCTPLSLCPTQQQQLLSSRTREAELRLKRASPPSRALKAQPASARRATPPPRDHSGSA